MYCYSIVYDIQYKKVDLHENKRLLLYIFTTGVRLLTED